MTDSNAAVRALAEAEADHADVAGWALRLAAERIAGIVDPWELTFATRMRERLALVLATPTTPVPVECGDCAVLEDGAKEAHIARDHEPAPAPVAGEGLRAAAEAVAFGKVDPPDWLPVPRAALERLRAALSEPVAPREAPGLTANTDLWSETHEPPEPVALPGLDVERLARALGTLWPNDPWIDAETIAAEYAREPKP